MSVRPLCRRTLLAGLGGLVLTAPLRAAETLPRIAVTKDPTCG